MGGGIIHRRMPEKLESVKESIDKHSFLAYRCVSESFI